MIPHCMWMLAAICGVVPAPLSSAPDVLLHGLEAATHLKDRTVARIAGIAGMVEPYAGKVLSAVSTTGGAPLYAGMGFTVSQVAPLNYDPLSARGRLAGPGGKAEQCRF